MTTPTSTPQLSAANDQMMRVGRILVPTLAAVCIVATAVLFGLTHYFENNACVAEWLHNGALLFSCGAFGFSGLSIMIFGAMAQAKIDRENALALNQPPK